MGPYKRTQTGVLRQAKFYLLRQASAAVVRLLLQPINSRSRRGAAVDEGAKVDNLIYFGSLPLVYSGTLKL